MRVLVNFVDINCSSRAPPLSLLRMTNLMVRVYPYSLFHNCAEFIYYPCPELKFCELLFFDITLLN